MPGIELDHDPRASDVRSPIEREPERQRIAADVAAFLKSGNRIRKYPVGMTGERGISYAAAHRAFIRDATRKR